MLIQIIPYRCPDRYLFDPATKLCQREHKVTCDTSINPLLLFNRFRSSLVFQISEEEMDNFFAQKLTLSTTSRTSPSSQSFNKHYLSAPFMYYPSYNYLYIWINNKISNFNFLASWKKTLWMLMKIKWNVKKVIDIFMLPNISIDNKPNGYKTMIVFQRLHKKDTLQFHINLTAKISMYIFNSRQTCCVCEYLFCSMHL